jgi:hypothetical protein
MFTEKIDASGDDFKTGGEKIERARRQIIFKLGGMKFGVFLWVTQCLIHGRDWIESIGYGVSSYLVCLTIVFVAAISYLAGCLFGLIMWHWKWKAPVVKAILRNEQNAG